MPIELRPGTSTTANIVEVLTGLDSLADVGVRADHPKLKPARKAAERVRQLRQQNAALREQWNSGPDHALTRLADDYARGAIEAEQVPEQVARITTMHTSKASLQTVLARAEAAASVPGIEACRKLGDAWITEILRPAVEAILAEISDDLAESAWDAMHLPDQELKHDRQRRDALDRMRDAIARLDTLHDHATGLRNLGWVPTPRRRTGLHAEDFRWLRHDRLSGSTHPYEVFFVLNLRNGAEPGLWTGEELLATNPTLGDDEPPKQPADAHLANAGKRVVA